MKPYLSVIILVHNNAKTLPLTLIDIDHHLQSARVPFEIIVCDNGSTDKTGEIAERFASVIKNVRVVRQGSPLKKSMVLRMGCLAARGLIFLIMSGDNAISIVEYKKCTDRIRAGGADFVVGSRLAAASCVQPALKGLQSFFEKSLSSYARKRTGIMVSDFYSPFFAISQAVGKLFAESRGVETDSVLAELLFFSHRRGYSIHETPITIQLMGSHKLSFSRYLQFRRELGRIVASGK